MPPKRGQKVKRVSLLFQEKEVPELAVKKTTPMHRLHPAIQSAIESYPFHDLEHVEPVVKQTLPTKQGKQTQACCFLVPYIVPDQLCLTVSDLFYTLPHSRKFQGIDV